MSTETLKKGPEKATRVPRFSRNLDNFAFYTEALANEAKKSRLNRLVGRLSIGTEKGKRDIFEVSTQKVLDRQMGVDLVHKAQEAARVAAEERGIDMTSNIMGSQMEDEHGITRALSVSIDRSADRGLPTHGHYKDTLTYTIFTLGKKEDGFEPGPAPAHSVSMTVGWNGEVKMTGPEGETSKLHAGSEAATRMLAQIDAFPPMEYPSELPF